MATDLLGQLHDVRLSDLAAEDLGPQLFADAVDDQGRRAVDGDGELRLRMGLLHLAERRHGDQGEHFLGGGDEDVLLFLVPVDDIAAVSVVVRHVADEEVRVLGMRLLQELFAGVEVRPFGDDRMGDFFFVQEAGFDAGKREERLVDRRGPRTAVHVADDSDGTLLEHGSPAFQTKFGSLQNKGLVRGERFMFPRWNLVIDLRKAITGNLGEFGLQG